MKYKEFKINIAPYLIEKKSKIAKNTFQNCFTGKDAVNVMIKIFGISKKEAVRLGQQFLDLGFINPYKDKQTKFKNLKEYYQLEDIEDIIGSNKFQIDSEVMDAKSWSIHLCHVGNRISKFVNQQIYQNQFGISADFKLRGSEISQSTKKYLDEKSNKKSQKRKTLKKLEEKLIPHSIGMIYPGSISTFSFLGKRIDDIVNRDYHSSPNEIINNETMENILMSGKNFESIHQFFKPPNM